MDLKPIVPELRPYQFNCFDQHYKDFATEFHPKTHKLISRTHNTTGYKEHIRYYPKSLMITNSHYHSKRITTIKDLVVHTYIAPGLKYIAKYKNDLLIFEKDHQGNQRDIQYDKENRVVSDIITSLACKKYNYADGTTTLTKHFNNGNVEKSVYNTDNRLILNQFNDNPATIVRYDEFGQESYKETVGDSRTEISFYSKHTPNTIIRVKQELNGKFAKHTTQYDEDRNILSENILYHIPTYEDTFK